MARPRLPRDERGWVIPRHNTLSYHIYLSMVMGLKPAKIAAALDHDRNEVNVLMWQIRHPDAKAARNSRWYHKKKAQRAMELAQ